MRHAVVVVGDAVGAPLTFRAGESATGWRFGCRHGATMALSDRGVPWSPVVPVDERRRRVPPVDKGGVMQNAR